MWHVFLAQLQNSRISPEQLWVSACSLHSGTPTGRWVQLILASSAGSLIPLCTNYCSQQCPVHFALLIVFMAKFWALSLGLFFFFYDLHSDDHLSQRHYVFGHLTSMRHILENKPLFFFLFFFSRIWHRWSLGLMDELHRFWSSEVKVTVILP